MFKFMKVVWYDACSTDEWTHTDQLPEPVIVTSYGWLSKEVKDYLCLSASRYQDNEEWMWGQTITIPSGMMISMTELLPNE